MPEEEKTLDLEVVKTKLREMVPEFAKRVAPLYLMLGWEWEPVGQKAYIPKVRDLEVALLDRIDRLTEKWENVGGGGIEAYYGCDGEYGLQFVLNEFRMLDGSDEADDDVPDGGKDVGPG